MIKSSRYDTQSSESRTAIVFPNESNSMTIEAYVRMKKKVHGGENSPFKITIE
jgi:hypothetical protein